LSFFYEDSIYFYAEKKDVKRVHEICKYYFKDFDYKTKKLKSILLNNENENHTDYKKLKSDDYNSLDNIDILTNEIICKNCKKLKKKINEEGKQYNNTKITYIILNYVKLNCNLLDLA
jgi:hypothetical protein